MRYLPEQVLKVWSPKPAQPVEALRDEGILSWNQAATVIKTQTRVKT